MEYPRGLYGVSNKILGDIPWGYHRGSYGMDYLMKSYRMSYPIDSMEYPIEYLMECPMESCG